MTVTQALSPYATRTDDSALRLERRLPGPLDRVWAWLTDSELRSRWLAAGAMTLEPGASFELIWHNDELSDSPAERPAGFDEEMRATCVITEVKPLQRLSFTWPQTGEVTITLEPIDDEVLLTIMHRRLPDRPMMLMVGAGWHMHLDLLAARLAGVEPASFWSNWVRLRGEYDRRLA